MSAQKNILILGATGSIGLQALDVVSASADLAVVGLSARNSWETLIEQARRHDITRIALTDEDSARSAAAAWPDGTVLAGAEGLVELIVESGADLVLNAIVAVWFASLYQPWFQKGDAVLLGVAVAIAAPIGDLFESYLKRQCGVKDSGRVFGAHGGALDRLDAVLFTTVVAYYVWLAILTGG